MLHFVYPFWLFALALLPLVALLQLQRVTRERRDLEGYAQRGALVKMGLWVRGDRRWLRSSLLLGAIAFGIVALAEPRWGGAAGAAVEARDGSLVVVLDVSRSMLAQDMGGESRLATAQRTIKKLLPSLAGWKVGLVGFAGEGQAMIPLTTDQDAVETLLERAAPGEVPGKGSNLEAGLKAAMPLFTHGGRQVMLVFSDGEELTGDAARLGAALHEAHIEVDTVGLGTPEGAYVPGPPDVWGNPSYLTYRGDKVTSRLVEAPLKQLASDTGGFYIRAVEGGGADLGGRLGGGAQPLPVTGGESQGAGLELFQLPLALALLLALLDAVLGLVGRRGRFPRRFADELRAAMRRPATAVLLFAIMATQSGWTWYPSWLPNQQAGQAFASGDYQRAGSLLDGALKHDPTNFGLQYNRANVAYAEQRYVEAIAGFRKALNLAGPAAKPVIAYNLGNAYFRQAEATGNREGYKKAIDAYQQALSLAPNDADAKFNLAIARKRHQQKKPPSSQPKSGKNGQSGQSQNQNQGQQATGSNPTYNPPPAPRNLPSESEVDTLLKALEADERQRQAEQAAERQDPNNGGSFAQQMLNQALGTLDLQKDW